MTKIIVTCAVTGSVHTPSMSPHLPITPEHIAAAAIEAAQAGASIVHLHARDPATGKPTQDPAVYRQFLPTIAAGCNVVINITTGGSPTSSLSERLQPAAEFAPEIASLNMGSMNFGMFQSVFGIRGGIGAHFEDITMMRRTADRLFGKDYVWSVLGAGRAQIPTATMGAILGGNVRVGLEDSLWGQNRQMVTNADQVRWISTILYALGHEVASPDEARSILELKGATAVKIERAR